MATQGQGGGLAPAGMEYGPTGALQPKVTAPAPSGVASPANPTGAILPIANPQQGTTPTAAQSAANSNPAPNSGVAGTGNPAPVTPPVTNPTANLPTIGMTVGQQMTGSDGQAYTFSSSGTWVPAATNPPPQTEEQIAAGMLSDAQSQIDAINASYAATIAQDTTAAQNAQTDVNASSARMGLMGSPTGASMLSTQAQKSDQVLAADRAAQATAIAAVYQTVDSNALAQANLEQQQAQTDAATYAANQQKIAATALSNAAAFAAAGTTGQTLAAQDPATWAQLQQQTGLSSYALTQYMFSKLPSTYQPTATTSYSADANGNTVENVVYTTVSPTTGKATVTQSSISLGIPYVTFNPAGLQTGADGVKFYINSDGVAINAETGQKYVPTVTLGQGQTLSSATTGAVIGQGQPSTTVVPLTSGTVQSGGAAGPGPGSPAASGAGSATSGGSSSSGVSSVVGGGANSSGGSSTVASTGTYTNGLGSNGQATWASLASLPTVTSKQLSLLSSDFASPQDAYDQGIQWILNGGANSSSGSTSSGGRGAVSGALSNSAGTIGAGILASYGLTEQDANTISELDSGLSSSLTGMIESQAGTKQFMTKAGTQVGILTAAITKYGDNTGSPLINVATQAFQNNVVSDPALQSFQVSLQSFLQDYSRITTNSTNSSAAPTDAANTTAQEKLNTLLSQGSLQSAIGTMVQEMNAMMSSYNTSVTSLQGQVSNLIQTYAATKNGADSQASGASDLGESGSTTSMAAPSTPSGMTAMVGPDGQTYNVPDANVQAFITAGGKKQ